MSRFLPRASHSLRVLLVALLTLSLSVVLGGSGSVQSSPAAAPPPPQLLGPITSIPPTRVLDTRGCCNGPIGFNPDGTQVAVGPLQANAVRRFLVNGKTFPQGTGTFTFPATYGVLANVTLVGAPGGGFVTVFPGNVADADRPNSSTVNPSTGVAFDFTAVGISPGGTPPSAGTIAIFSTNTLDVIVDVVGYFTAPTPAVLPIASGGTGITAGPSAAGQFLRSTGANTWAVGTITAADLPNLGSAFWNLNGNAGTSPASNFLGTTDGQSLILQPGAGNVGIGTTAPTSKLTLQTGTGYGLIHTNGSVSIGTYVNIQGGWIGTKSNHPLNFFTNDSTVQMSMDTSGRVGIGVAPDPNHRLILGGSPGGLRIDSPTTGIVAYGGNSNALYARIAGSGSSAAIDTFGNSGPGLRVGSASGNLVAGVNGSSAQVFHITQTGSYVTGSDFAEALPARGGKGGLEPGDVLVLSEEDAGTLELAQQPHDPRLAGVYSTRPGVLGADKDGVTRVEEDDVPLAIVGVVPTKVSAENGPIRVGDLLTTSSTPGYAMKATLPAPQGTLLGKAMAPLAEGTGVIKVLVSLR